MLKLTKKKLLMQIKELEEKIFNLEFENRKLKFFFDREYKLNYDELNDFLIIKLMSSNYDIREIIKFIKDSGLDKRYNILIFPCDVQIGKLLRK
ncbi:MAG: hypothetical protein ACTSVV_09685 [Promethearchaeota archaeon]